MRALWVAAVAAAACANASSHNTDQQPDIDAAKAIDAKLSTIDAPPQHPNDAPPANIDAFVPPPDAFVPVDAFVPPTPDASTDGNLCTAQSQCTDSGECCLDLGTGIGVCSPGVLVGTVCFPS